LLPGEFKSQKNADSVCEIEKFKSAITDFIFVEYTLPENNEQIVASKYKTVLPSKEDLIKLISESK